MNYGMILKVQVSILYICQINKQKLILLFATILRVVVKFYQNISIALTTFATKATQLLQAFTEKFYKVE